MFDSNDKFSRQKNPSHGLTTILIVFILFIIMIAMLFLFPALYRGALAANARYAATQTVSIATAQNRYYNEDLDGDGISNYAPNIMALVALGLVSFANTASAHTNTLAAKATTKDGGYKFQMTTSKDGSTYTATANPIKKYKDGEHRFKMSDTSAGVECSVVPKKKKKKTAWSTNLEACLDKSTAKTKRKIALQLKKSQNSLKKLYCQLIPSSLNKTALSVLTDLKKDQTTQSLIFNTLDENQDGELSAQELNLDSTGLWQAAFTLYDQYDKTKDESFNHANEPRDLLLDFIQSDVFKENYSDSEVTSEVSALTQADISFSKVAARLKAIMKGCK